MKLQQTIQRGQKRNQTKILVSVLILVVIVSASYFFYQSHKKFNLSMEPLSQEVINNTSTHTITKDFTYSSKEAAEVYALPVLIKGSLSYKIFINDTLVDSGEPKFGSAGSMPISKTLLKEGVNTLRVDINPQPEIGVFEKKSGCDIALIAANKDDIISTNIDENENIIARATCPTLFIDTQTSQKGGDQGEGAIPMTKESYDSFFAKTIPKDFITGLKSADVQTTVGPFVFAVWTSHDEVNPSINMYSYKIPNSDRKGAMKIVIHHVYTKKHNDIYDASDDFEKDEWQDVKLYDMETGSLDESVQQYAPDFYSGNRDVHIVDAKKGDYDPYTEGFTEYDGTLIVTLPLSEGGAYTKEFPFVLKKN